MLFSVCHDSTNMIATITVGISVQITSSRLLPWVWTGSSVIGRLSPVADHGEDDEPLDDEEDRGREEEDDVVEVADLAALGGHGLWREEAIEDAAAGRWRRSMFVAARTANRSSTTTAITPSTIAPGAADVLRFIDIGCPRGAIARMTPEPCGREREPVQQTFAGRAAAFYPRGSQPRLAKPSFPLFSATSRDGRGRAWDDEAA